MAENVEITAKLKLDTAEAEQKLKSLDAGKSKPVEVSLPKDAKIEVPKEATKGLKEFFTGPKGLLHIGRIAKSAQGGIGGLAGSMGSLASSAPKVAGIITLILAIIAMIIKLASGTDSFKAISDAFKQLLDLVKILLAPLLAFTAEITIVLQDLINQLKPLFDIVASLLKMALTPVLYIIKALSIPIKLILAALSPILELINQLVSLIGDALDTVLAGVIESFEALIEPLMKLFSVVSNIIKSLFGWIRDFLGIGSKSLYSTKGTEEQSFKSSLDAWETAGEKPTKGEEEIIDTLEGTNEAIEGIKKFLQPVLDLVKSVIEFVKPAIQKMVETMKKIYEPIMVVIRTVLEFVKPIIKLVGDVVDWISKNILKPLLEFLISVVKFIADFFANLVSAIASGVSNIFGGGKGEGFGGGLFNKSGRWGNGYQPGDIVGSVWDFVTGLAGKGWLWADGGTLDVGAQVWGMNEKGNPEFLFNAGGHDTVINKDILEEAMYRAVKRAGGTGGGRIEVSVKEGTPAGPRELAQWLLPSLKFALKN